MQIYWMAASNFSAVINISIPGYFLYLFVKPFLINSVHAKIVGAVYVFTMIFLYFIDYIFQNFVAYGIGVLLAFVVMCVLEKRNYGQKTFLGITFFCLRWTSGRVSVIIYTLIEEIFNNVSFLKGNYKLQFFVYVLNLIINCCVVFAFLYIAVKIFLRVYKNKKDNLYGRELLMLCTPSFMGTIIYIMESYYKGMINNAISLKSSAIEFLCSGVSYIAILTTVYLYQKIKDMQQEESRRELMLAQIEDIKKYVGETERHYKDIRGLKHDMSNHIMTLEGLYKGNKIEEAEMYADTLMEQLNSAAGEITSGNPVTDVILTEKGKEMRNEGIDFICRFLYPSDTDINAFDISVIMNNGLTNAITAAKGCENPFIKVYSYRKKNAYMIKIENSYKGNILIDDVSGLPVTTKERNKRHGLGLSNIKSVAQKYHGDIDIDYDEKRFVLSVMLIIK